jgi:hypothetical protein
MRRVPEEWPEIKAPRLAEILREHGYKGSVDLVKRRLRELRPPAERPPNAPATAPGRSCSWTGRSCPPIPKSLAASGGLRADVNT